MLSSQRFVRALTIAGLCACLASANVEQTQQPTAPSLPSQTSAPSKSSWLDELWNLPILHFFAPIFQALPEAIGAAPAVPAAAAPAELPAVAEMPALPPCSVAPLDTVTDPAAQALEANVGSGAVVDVADLQSGAAQALDRFQAEVVKVGGNMTLKSAYRPAAYQQHLQNVWYKWMDELRNNQDPACQDLKAQVHDEFLRHHLIETQHPVAVSDHTRGLAFDATVDLPPRPTVGRRRITLDSLARLAGLIRPAIAADPVHFKFVGKFVGKLVGGKHSQMARRLGRRRQHNA